MKRFDDYGAEIAPLETKRKGRGKQVETKRRENAKRRRISHGIILSCEEKKVFKDIKTPGRSDGAVLRIAVWSTGTKAVFEKRKYWLKGGTERLNRQLIGLDSDDIRFIADHADEIIEIMDKATSEIKIVKPEVAEKLEAEQNANS